VPSGGSSKPVVNPVVNPVSGGLTLVFSDDFDTSKVDTSKWNYDVTLGGGGVSQKAETIYNK